MKTEILHLKNLTKRIEKYVVLNSINLRLYKGETVFFLGKSGSGKTTLAKVISGAMEIDEGYIKVFNKHQRSYSINKAQKLGVFYTGLNTNIINNLSIWENIAISRNELTVGIKYTRMIKRRVEEACRICNVEIDIMRRPNKYRFFETLIIECIRAVYRGSKIVIFDNSLHLLTDQEAESFFKIIGDLKKRGITALFLEPNEKYALQYGERCVFLQSGRIAADLYSRNITDEKVRQLLMPELNFFSSDISVDALDKLCRTFRFPVNNIEKNVNIFSGELLGITSKSVEIYRWYLNYVFKTDVLEEINRENGVAIVTNNGLRSEFFPEMTIEENILLPAYNNISKCGFLKYKHMSKFFKNECGKFIGISEEMWNEPVKKFGIREREIVVLYSNLMKKSKIIILAGVTDMQHAIDESEIKRFAQVASAKGKAVVILSKNYDLLNKWCNNIIYLE